ncbi:leucine-rich repeat protein [Legionella sp. 27cVA30]|uniref:leucine-rich repeat protein n=1 Tax=Legionella sp. 27cVA30 TaxID=2905657 RepID=UPI00353218C5
MILSNDGTVLIKVLDADIENGTFAIPNSVTRIGNGAFFGCRSLSAIHLPEGITQIGGGAFSVCRSLKEIHLPEGITQIGGEAFYGCSSLKEIHLPEGITQIGYCAFRGCSSLRRIYLPEGITQIGGEAFYGCSSLKEIHLPEGITQIGGEAFYGCSSLREIHLPEGITQIGGGAFSVCRSLKEIHLPEGITQIGGGAFFGCSSLREIHLPEGITQIGYCAFSGCSSLKEIHLPEGITQIGNEAFYGCQSLADIVINSNDEKEIARVKLLLPKHLRQHVVSKAYYDKAQQKIESLLARPEFNPLYPFMVNESLSLFPDILAVIGGFERESSQSYQSAKQAMEALPIPKNDGQMQAYQEKIDDIAEQYLSQAEEEAVIPSKKNRIIFIEHDSHIYKERNHVERFFNRIKGFRRIATRYDKTAAMFLGALIVIGILLWLKL